jgi:DNA-binding CsgD family transcriptional regulator
MRALLQSRRMNPRIAADQVLTLLASLIDKSLLQATVQPSQSRLRMLEIVREFARAQLDAHGEADQVAAAHVAYMVSFAELAEPYLIGPEEELWRERCEAELGNLRAALTHCLEHDLEAGLRIMAPLRYFWNWYRVEEGKAWQQRLLERAQGRSDISVHTLARAYTNYAALAAFAGDSTTTLSAGSLAVELAAASGDRELEGQARWVHACRFMIEPTQDPVADEIDEALPLLREGTSTNVMAQAAYATSHRGVMAFFSGDTAQGLAYYEEALSLARVAGSRAFLIILLGDFAGWCMDLGNLDRAQELASEALALVRDDLLWVVGSPLVCMALVAATHGQPKLAARILGALDAMFRDTGLRIPGHFIQRLDRIRNLAIEQLGPAFEEFYMAGLAEPRRVLTEAATQSRQPVLVDGPPSATRLSPRQTDVLRLLVAGRSDRQIGQELYISHRTVSNHVAAILSKLGVSSRSEAAVRAVREGLI